uniref:Fucolectin tachylectin-4 pentraxin-1 domain-containing protein n=1 Tax=Cyprinodon variegatus TaxID=28743 RepID=A0A3Q2D301_CYPVA
MENKVSLCDTNHSYCLLLMYLTVNVAPRGRATQSAEPLSVETDPSMAIDSYRNPTELEKTCASVPMQDDPWWRLDLRSIYHITSVSITVTQCCHEQLNGAEIRVGLREDIGNHRCAVVSTAVGRYKYDYQCESMFARFLHVVLPGQQRNLSVCEVQVYGSACMPRTEHSQMTWKSNSMM